MQVEAGLVAGVGEDVFFEGVVAELGSKEGSVRSACMQCAKRNSRRDENDGKGLTLDGQTSYKSESESNGRSRKRGRRQKTHIASAEEDKFETDGSKLNRRAHTCATEAHERLRDEIQSRLQNQKHENQATHLSHRRPILLPQRPRQLLPRLSHALEMLQEPALADLRV